MSIKIGINGFGRIGRNFFRAVSARTGLEVVAVNDLADPLTLGHLLKHDSVMGAFQGSVEAFDADDPHLLVDGGRIEVLQRENPADLPWGDLGVGVAVEATGRFRSRADAEKHLEAGAERVVISAVGKDPDVTIVMGVNQDEYEEQKHRIISNASCTTNCLAPLAKVLHEAVGIEHGTITTVHSYTNNQHLLDLPHKDLRRARAAAMSMVPTTTGAAKATEIVYPKLAGRLDGISVRVPTPDVSLVDFSFRSEKKTDAETVNQAVRQAAEGGMRGILRYVQEPLVSVDFVGDPHSSMFDAMFTKVIQDRFVKVLSWYDNEWGYACRLADLIAFIGDK